MIYWVDLGPALINFFSHSIVCPALKTQFWITNSHGLTRDYRNKNGSPLLSFVLFASKGHGKVLKLFNFKSTIKLFTFWTGQMIFDIISSYFSRSSSSGISLKLKLPQCSVLFGRTSSIFLSLIFECYS